MPFINTACIKPTEISVRNCKKQTLSKIPSLNSFRVLERQPLKYENTELYGAHGIIVG
jgi:hypothetical protein